VILDLERLHGRVLVLFIDHLRQMLHNLVVDVVDMATSLSCRYTIDKRHLLKAQVRAGDGYFPAVVDLLVDELAGDLVSELVGLVVIIEVELAVVLELVYGQALVVEVDLDAGCGGSDIVGTSSEQGDGVVVELGHFEFGQVRHECDLREVFVFGVVDHGIFGYGHVVLPSC